MMGIKGRAFGPLPPVTLEELVPPDHFYRHLEGKLDLSFMRDLVRDAYVPSGRPSIDPVVFFKLQLVMFFEGIRSERKLIETASLNFAHRWYLGYTHTSRPSATHRRRTERRSAPDSAGTPKVRRL